MAGKQWELARAAPQVEKQVVVVSVGVWVVVAAPPQSEVELVECTRLVSVSQVLHW